MSVSIVDSLDTVHIHHHQDQTAALFFGDSGESIELFEVVAALRHLINRQKTLLDVGCSTFDVGRSSHSNEMDSFTCDGSALSDLSWPCTQNKIIERNVCESD